MPLRVALFQFVHGQIGRRQRGRAAPVTQVVVLQPGQGRVGRRPAEAGAHAVDVDSEAEAVCPHVRGLLKDQQLEPFAHASESGYRHVAGQRFAADDQEIVFAQVVLRAHLVAGHSEPVEHAGRQALGIEKRDSGTGCGPVHGGQNVDPEPISLLLTAPEVERGGEHIPAGLRVRGQFDRDRDRCLPARRYCDFSVALHGEAVQAPAPGAGHFPARVVQDDQLFLYRLSRSEGVRLVGEALRPATDVRKERAVPAL